MLAALFISFVHLARSAYPQMGNRWLKGIFELGGAFIVVSVVLVVIVVVVVIAHVLVVVVIM